SMKGRFTSSRGANNSAAFIAKRFQHIGLSPIAGNDGYYSFYSIRIESESFLAKNVVAGIKGKTSPDTIVIFSAHYDHIGFIPKDVDHVLKDSIYNGANDNASGVATMIELAKYYKAKNKNRYTLVFVAFSGEETGLNGSRDFAAKLDKKKVHAVINFDMVGRPVAENKKYAMVIGENSYFVNKLLNKQLLNKKNFFVRDQFPYYDLISRSDHASFPHYSNAISIMCTAPYDIYYHKVGDELETIDFEFLFTTTTNIARACEVFIQ
ncbi:MAG TPA: M20/M25/M40 family metallo-hydrolase, partial [Ferruginibacter sp.]|nr:M20/M25/M40 family metallo-hydrolase [Ferruginibacter sp.]